MGHDDRMIRVGVRDGVNAQREEWLVRQGDVVSLDVPAAGRVTLALTGGWSQSGIAYCHLDWEDEDTVGLMARRLRRDGILGIMGGIDAPAEAIEPILAYARNLVPEDIP